MKKILGLLFVTLTLIGCTIKNVAPNSGPNGPAESAGTITAFPLTLTIEQGESTTFTVTMNNSYNIVKQLVTFSALNNSLVSISPEQCTLSSTPSIASSCTISVTAESIGSTYLLSNANWYTQGINPIKIDVVTHPESGTIGFCSSTRAPLSAESAYVNAQSSINLCLYGSSNVNAFTAQITSESPSVLTLSNTPGGTYTANTSCTLSSESSMCTIYGFGAGSIGNTSMLTASASGYTSESVVATLGGSANGELLFNPSSPVISPGAPSKIAVVIDGTSLVLNGESVNFTLSGDTNNVTISSSSCNLSESRTCFVTLAKSGWVTHQESFTITATSTNIVNQYVYQNSAIVTVESSMESNNNRFEIVNNCPNSVNITEFDTTSSGVESYSWSIESHAVYVDESISSTTSDVGLSRSIYPCLSGDTCNYMQGSGSELHPKFYSGNATNNTLYALDVTNGFYIPVDVLVGGGDTNNTCGNIIAESLAVTECPSNVAFSTPSSDFPGWFTPNASDFTNAPSVNERQGNYCVSPGNIVTSGAYQGLMILTGSCVTQPPSATNLAIMYTCGFLGNPYGSNAVMNLRESNTNESGTSLYKQIESLSANDQESLCKNGPASKTAYVSYIDSHAASPSGVAAFVGDNGTSVASSLYCNNATTPIVYLLCPNGTTGR